jgi:hypothetical protein
MPYRRFLRESLTLLVTFLGFPVILHTVATLEAKLLSALLTRLGQPQRDPELVLQKVPAKQGQTYRGIDWEQR